MFTRSNPASGVAKPAKAGGQGVSFIGPEVTIGGDVATGGQLQVDGRINGNVRCASLCEGASGVISGDIVADDARLGGLVEGTVNAGNLIVEETARITGDVTYETITIAAGRRIDGRLARRQALAEGEGESAVLIATPTDAEPPAAADAEPAPGLFPATEKPAAS